MIKQIEGYERYTVSDDGRVFSNGIEMKQFLRHGNTYLFLGLWKNNVRKNADVHRLVALAFVPNPLNKKYVNHKNGIKTDNRVLNLEWTTMSENINHAYATGLHSSIKPVNCFEYPSKVFKQRFPSINQAAREMKVPYSSVHDICSGKNQRKSIKGLTFSFVS